MKESIVITQGPAQTKKLGEALAKMLLSGRSKKKAVVVGLRGDLGGGKTTFLQGFAKGLKVRVKVLSPTFIIIRKTDNFFHIDAYRLQGSQDLLKLGFREMLADPKNIVVVEWADRVKRIMPLHTAWVDFVFINKNKRRIVIRLNNGK
ncbi:MAG: tRNA (adenosine(37)-N6)-threonylcarbamoyltransferase complex ATPase subunit type 1 TsaE [Candidatus Nealsonbacteria bacterium]